jgi:hypothetical protein
MHKPIRTRRLKKADFEADFFLMGVWRVPETRPVEGQFLKKRVS